MSVLAGTDTSRRTRRPGSRGIALVTLAFAVMIFMGVAGLAVDVAYLYAARTEAQRSADAAALAAANDFANSGYTRILPEAARFARAPSRRDAEQRSARWRRLVRGAGLSKLPAPNSIDQRSEIGRTSAARRTQKNERGRQMALFTSVIRRSGARDPA